MIEYDFNKLTRAEKLAILDLYDKQAKIKKFNAIDTYFTDDGPNARTKYIKHMEFFKAGKTHKHRLIMAGNRSGKSLTTCFELVCHLTGEYPTWWEGRKFKDPHNWWVCGEDSNLIRQSIITTLIGGVGEYGTGLIRHKNLDFETMTDTTKVATTVTALRVKHKSGRFCQVDFKTYQMPRTAFQAAAVNIIFDEEPPEDIYNECVTRTATLGDDAMTIMNFTPLKGAGPLINNFLEGTAIKTCSISKTKHLTHFTMHDAPHLSKETIEDLIKSYPIFMRDARVNGLPVMGEGAVYPIEEQKVFIDPLPFSLPDHWKRFAAMDFGFKDPTVVLWFAVDPDGGTIYQYAEHYLAEAPVGTHAEIIKVKNNLAGFKIPIACDPSGGGRSIADGTQTRQMYFQDYELPMVSADNSIETGIAKVFQAMLDSKLKIFKTCVNTLKEFRSYSRFKNGFKGDDHAMDCLRYGIMTGQNIATSKAIIEKIKADQEREAYVDINTFQSSDSWMIS